MSKPVKVIIRIIIVTLAVMVLAALAHLAIFPKETKSILIDLSGFKKDGRIYFNPRTQAKKIDSLKLLISRAAVRMNKFWEPQ